MVSPVSTLFALINCLRVPIISRYISHNFAVLAVAIFSFIRFRVVCTLSYTLLQHAELRSIPSIISFSKISSNV